MSVMRNMARVAAFLAASTAAAGCAAGPVGKPLPATAIEAPALGDGAVDRKIGEGHYLVRFEGSGLRREQVDDYILYRAAQVTVRQGYDWFEFIDRYTERNLYTYFEPDPFDDPGGADGDDEEYEFWRDRTLVFQQAGLRQGTVRPKARRALRRSDLQVHSIEHFEAEAEIAMHKGKPPARDQRAVSARLVMQALGPIVANMPK
jgi:hypothetical protein